MSRIWNELRAGELREQGNVAPLPEEEFGCAGVLVYNLPDVVRLPPQLGGGVVKVVRGFQGPCVCGKRHEVLHLVLDLPEGLGVSCCDQYLWYRPRSAQG